jgi:hypothetical protein
MKTDSVNLSERASHTFLHAEVKILWKCQEFGWLKMYVVFLCSAIGRKLLDASLGYDVMWIYK